MSRVAWDVEGEHFYETGVDRGMLYPYDTEKKDYGKGVAWSGISAVNESPSGAEPNSVYADNQKYLNLYSAEEYGCTIEAFQSPEEFDECDGSKAVAPGVHFNQQTRKMFGFAYRTKIGTDTNDDYGYKIHLIYGCKASPSEQSHNTVNESPEASTLSWTVACTPVKVDGFKPFSTIEIDSSCAKISEIEDLLYGVDPDEEKSIVGSDPQLPSPAKILELLEVTAVG